MAKKKAHDFWDGLLTLGGILGFGWLMVEAIKLASKEEYQCSNCKATIKYKEKECPNCHATITWKV